MGALLLATGAAARAAPDLSGVWRRVDGFQPQIRTVEGRTPPLLPTAAKLYAERTAKARAGDHSFDNAATICVSPGMPRMMALPYPFQIVQSATQVAFLFEWNGRHRLVPLTAAAPDPPDLFYMGTATARFDGATLVVETRGLNDISLLDADGMPHSDQLRLTERYRLVDGGAALIDDIMIDDPRTFAMPWMTRVTYRRMPAGSEISEDVCRERVPNGSPAFEYDKFR